MTNPGSFTGRKTIEEAVCDEWRVTLEQIRSKSRKHKLPEARKVIVYFYKDILKTDMSAAGRAVGKDHSTASVAYAKFFDWMETDPVFRERANRALGNASPEKYAMTLKEMNTAEMSYQVKLVDNHLVISFNGPVWGITMNKAQFRDFVGAVQKVVCVEEEVI